MCFYLEFPKYSIVSHILMLFYRSYLLYKVIFYLYLHGKSNISFLRNSNISCSVSLCSVLCDASLWFHDVYYFLIFFFSLHILLELLSSRIRLCASLRKRDTISYLCIPMPGLVLSIEWIISNIVCIND